jgi:hypothetical protein
MITMNPTQFRADAIKQKFDIYLNKGACVVLVWNLAQSATECGLTFSPDDPIMDIINTYPANNP